MSSTVPQLDELGLVGTLCSIKISLRSLRAPTLPKVIEVRNLAKHTTDLQYSQFYAIITLFLFLTNITTGSFNLLCALINAPN